MVDEQGFLEINGADLFVTQAGKENGQAIVFLHGGPGLGDSRGDIVTFAPLAEEFRLVFLDLRGSGKSSDTPPFTHKQWVEDIEGLREKLGLGKICLHGSSYGGFLAQEYAAAYPENLEFLFLNVTTPDGTNDRNAINNAKNSDRCNLTEDELKRLFDGEVRDNEDFRYLYAGILPLYMVTLDPERDRKKLDQIHFHYATHNAAFRKLIDFDMKPQLPQVRVPTLVTAGEIDWITPAEFSEQIHELLPNSAMVVFKRLGHSLVREATPLYLEILKRFMNGEIERTDKIYDSRGFLHV